VLDERGRRAPLAGADGGPDLSGAQDQLVIPCKARRDSALFTTLSRYNTLERIQLSLRKTKDNLKATLRQPQSNVITDSIYVYHPDVTSVYRFLPSI
jgi:hypothetical protein